MDSLELNISFTMEQMEKVAPELFNYNLHTAQFQLFFVVSSSNPADGDFWYGIPFYEARQTEAGEVVGPNGGFDNGTSMWIASAGTRATVGEPIQKGKRYDVKFDILKGIKEGLAQAQENGYMLSTTAEDLSIANFNLGWEVPGIYDVSVAIHNFEIRDSFSRVKERPMKRKYTASYLRCYRWYSRSRAFSDARAGARIMGATVW